MKTHFPSEKELRNARDIFRRLLDTTTKEAVWQRFFAKYPYVLSKSLPLRLEPQDIIPRGRPGKSEPDFIFYPTKHNPIPFYGLIEIKRPDSKIITVTRSNVAIFTRDAQTAIEQARVYSMDKSLRSLVPAENILCLGNRSYIFIIMGMSAELSLKLGNSIFHEIIDERLPKNIQILPYDSVLRQFESQLPPKVFILLPNTLSEKNTMSAKELYSTGLTGQPSLKALRQRIRESCTFCQGQVGRTRLFDKQLSLLMLKVGNRCKASRFTWQSIGHAFMYLLYSDERINVIKEQFHQGLSEEQIAEFMYQQIKQILNNR